MIPRLTLKIASFSLLHYVYQLPEGNEAQRKPNQIYKNDQKASESR